MPLGLGLVMIHSSLLSGSAGVAGPALLCRSIVSKPNLLFIPPNYTFCAPPPFCYVCLVLVVLRVYMAGLFNSLWNPPFCSPLHFAQFQSNSFHTHSTLSLHSLLMIPLFVDFRCLRTFFISFTYSTASTPTIPPYLILSNLLPIPLPVLLVLLLLLWMRT